MRAVVMAGGQGVRLFPYTKILPKPLIPLDDVPIMQIILLQLREAGFTRITLSVCHKAHIIEHYFGNGNWLGLELEYSRTPHPLGTAGPLAFVDSLDQPFLVVNGDLLTTVDFASVFASHQRNDAPATMVLCRHSVNIGFGVVDIDDQQKVIGYVEKPNLSFFISGGIYVFEPRVLSYIPIGQYMDMPVLIQKLLENGHVVDTYHFEGDWYDIGTLSQYDCAEEAFRLHRDRFLKSDNIHHPSDVRYGAIPVDEAKSRPLDMDFTT